MASVRGAVRQQSVWHDVWDGFHLVQMLFDPAGGARVGMIRTARLFLLAGERG